jgi:serine/threonine protein kinase
LKNTQTEVMGSLYWAAPESISEGKFSMASDVYSYGITLWELITRKDIYPGKNPLNVAMEVVKGTRPPVPQDCPTEVSQLMEKCWDADPNKRPSFKEILRYLENNSQSSMIDLSEIKTELAEEAPDDNNVTIVFTDVEVCYSRFQTNIFQGSTALWEAHPVVMQHALRIHNQTMRSTMRKHNGYEIKTEGDSFMVAFVDPMDAILWCINSQKGTFNCILFQFFSPSCC